MNAGWIAGMGYVAGVCTTFSLVPQILRIVRLRSARDVSMEMFLLFSLGTLLWLAYGLELRAWPMILWNTISLLLSAVIVGLKLHFHAHAMREIVHPLSVEEDFLPQTKKGDKA